MQRLQSVAPAAATGRARELLGVANSAFGMTPNVAKVLANSPPALDAFLAFSTAMGGAAIGGKLHHQVKQATSEANACSYCASVLTALAPGGGLSDADVLAGRRGASPDPRTDAALKFAGAVLERRGKVTPAELDAVRAAGFTDAHVVEIVASVVLGCFTNFVNNVADTELDVPRVAPLVA